MSAPTFELIDATTDAAPNPYAAAIESLAETFDAETGRTVKALRTTLAPDDKLSVLKRKVSAAANALGYSPRITASTDETGTHVVIRLVTRIERTGAGA